MSKKRGLSVDEKRNKMRELFLETADVFTLKQLESVCPKQKGITSQSVKEILQGLVDDNLVKSEKIGTSNYFWCFPSDDLNSRQQKLKSLKEEVNSLKRKRENLEKEYENAKLGREESEERTAKIAKFQKLKEENTELKNRLKGLADSNPELIEAMRKDTSSSRDAANRWTDNIMTLRTYVKNQFNISEEDFNNNFGVPADLDYL